MKTHTIFIIALKVMGVYLLAELILQLPTLLAIMPWDTAADTPFVIVLYPLLSVLMYVALIVACLIWPEWVIQHLRLTVKLPVDHVIPQPVHFLALLRMAIIVLGLWLMARGLIPLLREAVAYFQSSMVLHQQPPIPTYFFVQLSQLLVAFLLVRYNLWLAEKIHGYDHRQEREE